NGDSVTPPPPTTTEQPTTAPPSSPPAPAPAPPPPAPAPSDLSGFITGYYGMLPRDTSGAWSELSPSYQSQTGGYAEYVNFWSSVSAVQVSGVSATGPNRATATLTYTKSDGTVTSESRWFTVDSADGRMVITGSGT
ncbi:MAG: serine/threonine protein kinase, partial [Nocardia sp.]|nr:serine/threonine protein kinase [Nocardia sp.]